MDMETMSSPGISPDGKHILFVRGWIDKMNDNSRSNLWITDVEGKRIRELTAGNWRDSNPSWSPDGEKIAFLSNRDGTAQIHVMFFGTREVAQLTHLDRAPGAPQWSPDGKKLAYTSMVPDTGPLLPIELPRRPEGARWAEPALIIDRLVWRANGSGNLPRGYSHIFVLDAEIGGVPRQVTSGDYSHRDPQWSSDGMKIYFTATRKPDAEYPGVDSELYSVDLASLEIKALTNRKGPDQQPCVSPDGKWIVYSGYDETNNYGSISSLYIMDSNGGNKRLLATNFPDSPGDVTWAPDGSGVYYLMGEKGESNLHFLSTNGMSRRITTGVHVLSNVTLSNNAQVAATRSSFDQPPVLTTFNLDSPARLSTLVDVNSDVLAGVKLGAVEELWAKAPDGVQSQGWLMKPAEFDPNKKYPLVLWIHGGPVSMYSVAFNWVFHFFSASGYAVLWMNPRGSLGYGQFGDSHHNSRLQILP